MPRIPASPVLRRRTVTADIDRTVTTPEEVLATMDASVLPSILKNYRGIIGAIVGHLVMGLALQIFSILGMLALSGVVVNSSLVLVDNINRQRAQGMDVIEAVTRAGIVRFRPILLTSVTTFVGLMPIMLTRSSETIWFTPMAVSLGWGVLFATVITLFLVPCLYLALEDLHVWRNPDPTPEIASSTFSD